MKIRKEIAGYVKAVIGGERCNRIARKLVSVFNAI